MSAAVGRPALGAPTPQGPAGLVTLFRPRLRLHTGRSQTPACEGPARVLRVDPDDGSTSVFRDAPVAVHLSRPVDPRSVSARTLRVEDGQGEVPARVQVSPDGWVLLWSAERLLTPGVEHRVVTCGLRDLRGLEFAPHESRFTACDLVWRDLSG